MTMTLQKIQEQALMLPYEDRWQLINALMKSVQPQSQPKGIAASLISIAKTDALPPTDEEVKAMLEERLLQKYL